MNSVCQTDKRFQDSALLKPIARCPGWFTHRAALLNLNTSAVEEIWQYKLILSPGCSWMIYWETLTKCAISLTQLIGSTYLCQSAFSYMKISKSKYRSTVTDGHLEACLRIASCSFCPDYEPWLTPSSASHQSMYSVYMNKYMFTIF